MWALLRFFSCPKRHQLGFRFLSSHGLISFQLRRFGYGNLDAVDASPQMIEIARSKNLYNKIVEAFVGPDRLPLDDGKLFYVCETENTLSANGERFRKLFYMMQQIHLSLFAWHSTASNLRHSKKLKAC